MAESSFFNPYSVGPAKTSRKILLYSAALWISPTRLLFQKPEPVHPVFTTVSGAGDPVILPVVSALNDF